MTRTFLQNIILLFALQLSLAQVTFVIEELPEGHDFEESIFISGDFEDWTGGAEEFKLTQEGEKYSITLPAEYCKILFKFTLGTWSTVELNADGSSLDNRVYDCNKDSSTVSISIKGWTVPGAQAQVTSTARENVRILSEEFEIPQLDRKRRIWIYLPNDYEESTQNYPVIYMHDGQNLFDEATAYAGEWNVDEIMDRITENTGFKAIVVGIDNGGEHRLNEYLPWPHERIPVAQGEEYVQFLVETLKPYIDQNFRTKAEAENTAMMGSSLGGLITHYASLNHPDVFGKAGVFSPSFWIADNAYQLASKNSKQNELRMYFLIGDKEGESAVPNMDRMIELMKNSGFPAENIKRKVVEGGQHNEKLWRDAFEESILWLFDVEVPVLGNSNRTYQKIKQTDNGFEIEVSDGIYKIKYYTSEIVETTFIPEGEEFKTESHAVVLNSKSLIGDIDDGNEKITIDSEGIDITISKDPFQIAYLKDGKPILSEKKGYHITDYGEAIEFNISQQEVLYGAGSRALGMNRRGNRLQLYNRAHYGYEYRSPLMNFSMPIVISSNRYMVHFDNAPIGYLDLDSEMENTITYETISGRKTYQVITADSWHDLMDNYTDLTGKQPLPPRWAFGNFASRFGYHTETETRQTIQKFKDEEIPVDAVILDVFWFGKDIQGHMGNLEFLKDSFPTPLKMIKDFRDQDVKTILITEPFILTTSKRWEEAVEANALATDSLGNPFIYDFYFGNTGLIDIYSEDGKKWFWDRYKEIAQMGAAGVWGDLGEPEVHPSEMIHATGTADEVHNTYGHDWAKLVYEGYRRDFPDQRPFILMRAGYSGSQRFGLIPWSGDVSRSWGGLIPQTEIALQMAMQGMGYMHSDLGGFAGGNLDDELYTRWLQYGVFQPIFRPHAQEIVPSEPVYREKETMKLAKKTIELRYKMLPYNYTVAFLNMRDGTPMMRPLFFEEDENEDLFVNDKAYLWGNNFLVSPIVEPGIEEQEVYFPSTANWYDFYSGEKVKGVQTIKVKTMEDGIPTFVRGGAFIPFTNRIDSTEDYDPNEIVLHFYFDETVEKSEDILYVDDGETPDAFQKGEYEILKFESELKDRELKIDFSSEIGENYSTKEKKIEFSIKNIDSKPEEIRINTRKTKFIYNSETDELTIPISWDSTEKLTIEIPIK